MSCFMQDKDHIDLLVTAARHLGVTDATGEDLCTLGRDLWQENWASYSHRYAHLRHELDQEEINADTVARYLYVPVDLEPISLETIRQAVGGYEYQSLEHPGWLTSAAAAFVRDMDAALDARGISSSPGGPGWAWTRPARMELSL